MPLLVSQEGYFDCARAGVVDTESMLLWCAKVLTSYTVLVSCTSLQPQHFDHFDAMTIPKWSAFSAIKSETNSIIGSCQHTDAVNVDLFLVSLEAGKFQFLALGLRIDCKKSKCFNFPSTLQGVSVVDMAKQIQCQDAGCRQHQVKCNCCLGLEMQQPCIIHHVCYMSLTSEAGVAGCFAMAHGKAFAMRWGS